MKLSLLRRNSSTPPPSPVTSPKTTPRSPTGGSTTGLAKWEDQLQQQSASPNPTPSVSSLLPSPRTFIYPQPPPDMVGGVELGGGGGEGAARVLPSPTASPRDRPCSPRWVPDKANPDEQLLRAHAQAQAMAYVRRHSLARTHTLTRD